MPVRAVILGLAAGFVSGLLGIGGGVIIVPSLVLWLGLDLHRASATSLTVIVVAAATAALSFALDGDVDWPAALTVLVGSGVGAFAAARAMVRIPSVWLARAFVVVALIAAARLALDT
jgi:uncharacterized membrane protein YfcA